MTTRSSMLHVRMDAEMKRKATAALAAMGLTASEAVRLLFHRIAVDQAFPLELKVPNAQTRRAMAEVDGMVKTRTARFASADEMFAELEEAGDLFLIYRVDDTEGPSGSIYFARVGTHSELFE